MEVNEARSRCGVIEERRRRSNMWRGRRRDSYLMRRRRPSFPSSLAAGALGSDELPSAVVPPSLWTEGATRRCSYWAGLEDTLTAHRESTQHRARANSWPRPKKGIHDLAQHDSSKVQTEKNIQARTHHVHSGLTFHHVHNSTGGESSPCVLPVYTKHTQKKKKTESCISACGS